jgi:GNAT superfamily N-acetyltransferase
MSDRQASRGGPSVSVLRCRDPELIADILRRDYFDDPFPHLSDRVIRTFARAWVAGRPEVYLLTAEAGGAYAGFVFGHTLGPRFWRLVAARDARLRPGLMWAALKMKAAAKLKPRAPRATTDAAVGDDLESRLESLGIPTLPRPFEWSPAGGVGLIPLVFVHPERRGHGVAPRLLEGISEEMFRDGARSVEAHIDLHNLSSARAFLKAGFGVYRMATGDLWARKSPAGAGGSE